jgi:hypothetical protein
MGALGLGRDRRAGDGGALPVLDGQSGRYLSDTLVGALVIGFAVCAPPEIGPSPLAVLTGPETPPGWSYNPSAWT